MPCSTNLTIKTRLTALIVFLSVLLAGIGFMGLRGMGESNAGLKTVFEDRLIPSGQVAVINNLMAGKTCGKYTWRRCMTHASPKVSYMITRLPCIPTRSRATSRRSVTSGPLTWQTTLTPEEKILAEDYTEKRKKFVQEEYRAPASYSSTGISLQATPTWSKW